MAKNLLFDCSYSELWVHPNNWKTLSSKKSLDQNWYIECKFYDPVFKEKYPKGFPFRKKLNRFKTLEERKAAIEILLKEIPILFEEKGWNPISKKFMVPEKKEIIPDVLNPDLPVMKAFRLAHAQIKASDKHVDQIRFALNRFEKAINELKYQDIKIIDFKRSHLKTTLDHLNLTDDYYNKYRAYFSSLFYELLDYDCAESNYARDLRKRKTVKKMREILEIDTLKQILSFLKMKYPEFYNYTNLFFYSGARSSELFRLKAKDVDLNNQEYKVTIQKGTRYIETTKIILPNAIRYWEKALSGAKPNEYLFSANLVPGEETVNPNRITRRWKMHVKDKLLLKNGKIYEKSKITDSISNYEPVTADFYALKHLFLDFMAENKSIKHAKEMGSHTTDITEKVYLVGKKKRDNEALKRININVLNA